MKVQRRNPIVVIILAALIAGLIGFLAAHNAKVKKQEAVQKIKEGKEVEQKVLSFSIDGRTSKGVKSWHLEGKTAEFIDDEIFLNDLKAYALTDNGKIDLVSDRGVFRRSLGEVELIGNVKVLNDMGVTLISNSAKWSQNSKEILSDDIVYIEHEKMKARGEGAIANSEEKIAILKKNVEVNIEPDTEVRCDGPLEMRYEENTATFKDNVRVKDKDGKIFADKLIVYFGGDEKKLERVEAEGNVKVQRGKSYTLCEKAVYTESTKHAKLTGRAQVIIDPEQISEFEKMY